LCFVRNDSQGALDNATGVTATLIASRAGSIPGDLGVLITSGEELGLAGARAWAAGATPEMLVINCDTVDDVGRWRCMYSGAKPRRIGAAAAAVAGRLGLKLPIGRLIPGILADSMAFADRGIESVTLSRGTLSTLARIHTRRDTSSALGGRGVAEGAAILSALAKELA
jgi:Zn-dependent M28 family amino/carboxypeptidase